MAGRGVKTEQIKVGEELSKRQERAMRILDAAAELIRRWGYKKTTMDDIAHLAGVAKGTIYLHWKTREDLFVALLISESLNAYSEMQERIDKDPDGMYLSNITKHTMAVVMTRPLAKALFIQDINILGELLQSGREDLRLITQRKLVASEQLLALFRDRGMLRTELSLTDQIKIYSAVVAGFLTVDQYLPPELQSSPEEAVELLAKILRETLEPAEPVAPETIVELRAIWNQIIQQFLTALSEQFQQTLV